MKHPVLLQYPAGALLRVSQICRDPKTGKPGLVPWVQRTWLKKVEKGEVPPGRKIGEKTRVWTIEEVLATCASMGTPEADERDPASLKKARAVRAEQIEQKRQAGAQVGE
jgi:hypothetical protein